MTAPDPRVGEIEARLARRDAMVDDGSYKLTRTRCNDPEIHSMHCPHPKSVTTESLHHDSYISHLEALADAVPYLLAELRKAHEALARVEDVAARLNSDADNANEGAKYAAEMNDGASLRSFETERFAYQQAERHIRAAVAAAKGDGE